MRAALEGLCWNTKGAGSGSAAADPCPATQGLAWAAGHCECPSRPSTLSIATTIISTLRPKAPVLPQQQALLEPPAGIINHRCLEGAREGGCVSAPKPTGAGSSHPSSLAPLSSCLLTPAGSTCHRHRASATAPSMPKRNGPRGNGPGWHSPAGYADADTLG